MTEAFAELPLAIFTTLAAIGVGAYVTIAIAYMSGKFSNEEYQRTAKFTAVPLGFMVVGVLASFMHLSAPLNATNVFSTVGSTPMANEIIWLVVFGLLALIYFLAGGLGKMPGGTHKVLGCALAVLGVICCIFIGCAYTVATIPSWNTLFTPMSMLGFGLFGGGAVGMFVLAKAGVSDRVIDGDCANRIIGVDMLGFILAVMGVIGIYAVTCGTNNALINGAEAAGEVLVFVVISVILMVLCAIGFFMAAKVAPWVSVSAILMVLMVIAVFLARLAFYGMQVGMGL